MYDEYIFILAMQECQRGMGPKGSQRHRLNSPTTYPRSFYKIIFPSIIYDHKLRIPEEFAKKHGNELSTSAMLIVPSGRIWYVGVEKADKMLWFHDGWKEFAEHHSIRCGFFVVFNYEGNSKFNVLIFDLTASEIHNPRNTLSISEEPNHGKLFPGSNKGEREGNDPVETLRSSVSRPTPVSLDQQTIGKRCYHSLLQNLFEFAPEFALRINKHGSCISSWGSLRSNTRYFTRNKRYKMEHRGEIIKLENDAREMLKPEKDKWNLTKNVENIQAAVPFDLLNDSKLKNDINRADKEGRHPTKDSVFVQVATQSSQFNEITHTQNTEELNLLSADAANQGADSNGQQLMVKHEEEVEFLGLKTSRKYSIRQPVTTQEREKAVNAAMKFKPKNPSFMIILRPYNVDRSYILNMPSKFMGKYLHGVTEFIKLEVSDGKQWTIRCIQSKSKLRSLSRGWATFVRENHLMEGDVCVFELIQVEDVVLKVYIFRALDDARRTNLLK